MTESVIIGRATLYLGDAREILPTLGKVDHIIADPPYEDELHAAVGKFATLRNDGKSYASNKLESFGFDGVNLARDEIAAACVEASQGWCILFTLAEGVRTWRDALQAHGAKYDTCCAWIKPDSAPRFNGQGPARGFECFVTAWCAPGHRAARRTGGGHAAQARRGHRSWNAGGKRGIYTYPTNNPDRTGLHPTEKPRRLMAEIISDFTSDGQTICDPFMGSGTTGVAAVQMGRDFIGIEQDPAHFATACKRIEDAQRQGDMFLETAA